MTNEEIEAVAKAIEARADAREEEGASEQREAWGMYIAARMLREALAKSDSTLIKYCIRCKRADAECACAEGPL